MTRVPWLIVLAAVSTSVHASKLIEPLPLDAVTSIRLPVMRSEVDLSPDGAWIAHTTMVVNAPPSTTTSSYTMTGAPYGDGYGRMQARLTGVRSGEIIPLGGDHCSSWAPGWSPDGQRVAFYSDCDGEAGVWIWEVTSRRSRRIASVIARGSETPRWSRDGRQLLVPVLPEGMTVAQANALAPISYDTPQFRSVGSDEPSVLVFHAAPNVAGTTDPSGAAPTIVKAAEYTHVADLALLDADTGAVKRVAPRSGAVWWEFSPDGRSIAYTTFIGAERDTLQGVANLVVYDLETGRNRVLLSRFRTRTGENISWSPDSRHIAFITTGQTATGECLVVSTEDGTVRKLGDDHTPSFNTWGTRPPLWDAHGENVYLAEAERVWRFALSSGRAVVVARLPGYTLGNFVTQIRASRFWSPDGGRSLVVRGSSSSGDQSGFYQVDLQTGKSRLLVEDTKKHSIASGDVHPATGEFTFIAQDMKSPPDIWLASVPKRTARRVTRLNEEFDRYELGHARMVEWLSAQGELLRGTLLLPAAYQKGRRYPLVVWVYEGRRGSEYLNRFGIRGQEPVFNFHVLATRGYAVFFPDAPVRVGTPMTDLVGTVMPGVNKVIELGIADPERLAVMGHSYGSYCTLALIAQTSRFKAAIITAVANPDLVGGYLEMGGGGEAYWTGYYEHGQGNMGGTPWQYKERYLTNSPIFLFDRITTPLLIGHGSKDGLPIRNPASVFVALRRLGKEVEYRLYEGEEHDIMRKPNVIDFWQRRLEFLAEHLELKIDEKGAVIFGADHTEAATRRSTAL